MRLAWFSPWPPDPSGIAGRSAELLPRLAARGYAVDVFVDAARVPVRTGAPSAGPGQGEVRVLSAHEFVWRTSRHGYDLPVYQVGNSRLHEYLWPYLFRWPGLAVLHDARLHHARGRATLGRRRDEAYRHEFSWNHPGVSIDAAELAVAGFDGPYYYQWPMTRAVAAASRLVACHSVAAVDALRAESPPVSIEYVPLGEGAAAPPSAAARAAARQALALPADAVIFGLFGALTTDRRVPQVLRAFAATRDPAAPVHLLLAGRPDASVDLRSLVTEALEPVVHVRPDLDDARFDQAIEAADVSLNLRWPTALETSGPWLRALAAARPTVVVDLESQAGLPTLDPRTWQPHAPARRGGPPPIAVAIDILDEDHSLRRAMARLGRDANLRRDLGAAGRAYWEAHHTVDRMVDAYDALLPRAASAPAPGVALPEELRPDALAATRALIADVGMDLPRDLLG